MILVVLYADVVCMLVVLVGIREVDESVFVLCTFAVLPPSFTFSVVTLIFDWVGGGEEGLGEGDGEGVRLGEKEGKGEERGHSVFTCALGWCPIQL